mmetsp:Transcript_22935/g.51977  ORF Transcript_22935/g.51977 Transcript_22935/m.51977 type:complete len:567 (+) Transcript_22935:194-1894(+)
MGGEVPPETEQDEKTSSVDSRDDVENQKPSVDTSSIESSIAAAAAVSSESNFHQKQQDAYVKKGTRVALLLKTALRSMAEGLVVPNEPEQNSKKRSLEGCTDHKRRKKDFAHAEQIALEKEEECNTLRRKLQDSQSRIEMMQNENTAFRDKNDQLQVKADRAAEALRIAGQTAASAKAEADAAKARADSLSSQLEELQKVIQDNKRSVEAVRQEHEEVSRAARSVESRLILVDSELSRVTHAKEEAEGSRDFLQSRAEKAEADIVDLTNKLDDSRDLIRALKKDVQQSKELDKSRTQRALRMENELSEARQSLMEAASAACEGESTVASLRSVIEEMRRENEQLHENIASRRDAAMKERSKQNDREENAEREAQKLRLQVDDQEDVIRKLTLEKASLQKQNEQMKKRRLSSGFDEDRRKGSTTTLTSTITPSSSSDLGLINSLGGKGEVADDVDKDIKNKEVMKLPQRATSNTSSAHRHLTYSAHRPARKQSEQSDASSKNISRHKTPRPNVCCVCNKEGGMLLSCQCGSTGCDKRAHILCISSVRRVNDNGPTILCDGNGGDKET